MKNEAEIIWWKTVKQDVETTPRRFTGAGARVAPPRQAKRQAKGGGWKLDDKNIFKRIPSSSSTGNYNSSRDSDRFTRILNFDLPAHTIGVRLG